MHRMLSGILIILRRNRGDNIQWFLYKYSDVDSEILYVHKHNLMTVSHNPGPHKENKIQDLVLLEEKTADSNEATGF